MTGGRRGEEEPGAGGASDAPGPDRRGGSDGVPDPLAAAVDRMAHQLRNPLQAVAVNLEVVRSRVRKEEPELWEGLERFGRAVDDNVELLDRRLRLLVALARRGAGDRPGEHDPAELAGDLASALRLDEEAPGVEVDRDGAGADGPAARLRPGHLLALLLDAWLAAARAGADSTPVTSRRSSGSLGLAFPVPRAAAEGRGRWEEMARSAGGSLEAEERGERTIVHVAFPTA